ncbi:MAG: UDP-N-acetylmuramoyl-L-alanyl-D-glutamate--2,6-diaminopimelate ligase [Planctomycetota bacterium]|nr:MAG: UDP-N-acetylmuramoyl-L-alanyl-D-glutamate--2,6-diaminopimelate ligase [Planctomycetota bacterium]
MKHSVNRISLKRLCEPLVDGTGAVALCLPATEVTGITGDSRKVRPGDLFVASAGARVDGADFVAEALSRGAAAVASERPLPLPKDVGAVCAVNLPAVRAQLADRFFQHPSGRLTVVGVTGTNGKTTTCSMLRSMLTMDGQSSGVIGTLGAWVGETHEPLANTTPDAIELQRLLARMVDKNLSSVVMEVSSHALSQHRVDGVDFDLGVFTNLSQDHLDYHGSMEAYAAAKGRLFAGLLPDATAVLNGDDPLSQRFADETVARVLTYGLQPGVDVHGDVRRLDAHGTGFQLVCERGARRIDMSMRQVGRHNVANALAAASAGHVLGLSASALRAGLSALAAVPGRLEPVDCGQDFRVLVDYAHTPDALEQVLALLRPLTRGRLHVVFGCGGDRDAGKRPLMGAAAARHGDVLYVTSDNPRGEPPATILDEVLAGMPQAARREAISLVDRREAIQTACREARGGDVVLVAGKGHETTQTIGEQVLPFDDRDVAREVLWTL